MRIIYVVVGTQLTRYIIITQESAALFKYINIYSFLITIIRLLLIEILLKTTDSLQQKVEKEIYKVY